MAMTPLDKCIEVFGSKAEIERILGLTKSACSGWKKGAIPAIHQARLLTEATRRELDLKASDLIWWPNESKH